MNPPAADNLGKLPALLAALACFFIVGLNVLPPSTSQVLVWPYAGLAALGWVTVSITVFTRLCQAKPLSRFGGFTDLGLITLVSAALASAAASPIRDSVLPHLLPFLGICALPYALLPGLHSNRPDTTRRLHLASTAVLLTLLFSSLFLWLRPWSGFDGFTERNAQPFGHPNTTGSFGVLAATWLVFSGFNLADRARKVAFAGACLAVLTALSSQSRGAVLALAVAATTAAAIHLLGRHRYLAFALLGLLIAGGVLVSSARMRELVVHQRWSTSDQESNRQRTAMILGGIELGKERPLQGWGAGAVPHVFPRVRAALPGTADNFLHLHNTPVQLWATLGFTGLLGGLFIILGLAAPLRKTTWTPARTALAAGLAGGGTTLLFDHPFDATIFSLLAAAHLTAWVVPARIASASPLRFAGRLGFLAILAILPFTVQDLIGRALYADALEAAEKNDSVTYRIKLEVASNIDSADPFYAHQYASHFATGHPFKTPIETDPAAAISPLRATLLLNPDLEYAHYNLGWLLLGSMPAEAESHFIAAANLAPQRGGVYHGLGLARLQRGDNQGALRALAIECLHDPAFFWSPDWLNANLSAVRPAVLELLRSAPLPDSIAATKLKTAWSLALEPLSDAPRYRRVRTGYGVLMGHPDGVPPADVNIQRLIELPPSLVELVPPKGWLPGPFLLDFLGHD